MAIKMSFLILTWNRAKFLEMCLSKLTDAIRDLNSIEIIIMNNGSTDQTYEVAEKYRDKKYVRIFHNKKNYGLSGYKRLFRLAKGEYIVMIDDDVLDFPAGLDHIFEEHMKVFTEYGFVALDVIQNEFTNGAKPGPESYTEIERKGLLLQDGPTGAWCTCIRKKDFDKIRLLFRFGPKLSFKMAHDGYLQLLFKKFLKLKSGIIKDKKCFHASGPHYSKQYGFLDHDMEKYRVSGMDSFVKAYQKFK